MESFKQKMRYYLHCLAFTGFLLHFPTWKLYFFLIILIILRYFLEKYGLYCITAVKVIKTFIDYLIWTITV